MLTVTATERLAPQMLRVHFTSPDLVDFESAGADDHVKLFVPDGAGGMAMRDYTPRAFDTGAMTLLIDFALHDDGPATRWRLAPSRVIWCRSAGRADRRSCPTISTGIC